MQAVQFQIDAVSLFRYHVFDRLDSSMLWRTLRLQCLTVPTARLMLYGARQDGFLFDFVPTFFTARLIRDRESRNSFMR